MVFAGRCFQRLAIALTDGRGLFPLHDLTETHAQVLDKPGAAWLMMSRQSCMYALSARPVAKAVSCDARAAAHTV